MWIECEILNTIGKLELTVTSVDIWSCVKLRSVNNQMSLTAILDDTRY